MLKISLIVMITSLTLGLGINNKSNLVQTRKSVDTSFLKTVSYTQLNNLVRYHIMDAGKPANRSKIIYKIHVIAAYYYYKKGYEIGKKDTQLYGKSSDVTKLILSNKFSNRIGFDGIFKVNSNITFIYKPNILRKITVSPKSGDAKSLHSLMSKLDKENYVSHLSLDTVDLKWPKVFNVHKSTYITVLLKSMYRNVRKTKDIQTQLRQWPDIRDVLTSVDFFSGRNEYDIIYRITSQEKE